MNVTYHRDSKVAHDTIFFGGAFVGTGIAKAALYLEDLLQVFYNAN